MPMISSALVTQCLAVSEMYFPFLEFRRVMWLVGSNNRSMAATCSAWSGIMNLNK